MNIVNIFILVVLAFAAALFCVAIMRLNKHNRRQEQQIRSTSKTIARLISRNVELNTMLGRSLL